MKNNNLYSVFIISCLFLLSASSCQTVRVSDLNPRGTNAQLLPPLKPHIDLRSFESAYSIGSQQDFYDAAVLIQEIPGGEILIGENFGGSTFQPDKRIQESITIFKREIVDNISQSYGDAFGSAVCRISVGDTKIRGWGFYALSLATLSIPNWFGMPVVNFKTMLEVDVEIRDCKNVVIGRYRGDAYEKAPVALWHGYRYGDQAARMSNIKSFKKAMRAVKYKIGKDYNRLNTALLECGPIAKQKQTRM